MDKFDYESIREKVVDSYGRRVVLSLFSEFKRTEFEPLWSLKKDWKRIYLEAEDPTEYEAAMRLIGDWDHYQLIRNHPKIKPVMDEWAKELEIRLRSNATRSMLKHAKAPNGAAAAKWIAEGGFTGRDLRKKNNKQEEEEVRTEINERVAKDMERLGLALVAGGKKDG